MSTGEQNRVMLTSLYGLREREPLVQVEFIVDGETAYQRQFRVEEALSIGHDLIEVAVGSTADAFLLEFVSGPLGLPIEQASMILRDFRQWREARVAKAEKA